MPMITSPDQDLSALMRSTSRGTVATTLAKMMIDIPWPMPRWVMSSPSHMTNAVPAVNVRMMNSTRIAVKSGMRSMFDPGELRRSGAGTRGPTTA